MISSVKKMVHLVPVLRHPVKSPPKVNLKSKKVKRVEIEEQRKDEVEKEIANNEIRNSIISKRSKETTKNKGDGKASTRSSVKRKGNGKKKGKAVHAS